MFLTKLKSVTAAILVGLLVFGLGWAVLTFASNQESGRNVNPAPAPLENAGIGGLAKKTKDAPGKGDANELQGEWRTVDVETNGTKARADNARDLRLVFKGDEITLGSVSGEGRERKQKYKLAQHKSPKEIDITSLDGAEKDQTAAGIYALEKGQLQLCVPYFAEDLSKRPTEFKTKNGDGLMLIVLERPKLKEKIESAPPKAPDRTAAEEFASIRAEWQRADLRFHDALHSATSFAEKKKVRAEKVPNPLPYAVRCLKLAQSCPGTPTELAALSWAVGYASHTEPGRKACATLKASRIASADLLELAQAFDAAQVRGQSLRELAPVILERVKRDPDHAKAAWLATWVCTTCWAEFEQNAPPLPFAEAADLIVAKHAGSPDLVNFCEGFFIGHANPHWAGRFERHLRTILKENRHRPVRCAASFALACVVHASDESRQVEAEALYQRFLEQFDGKHRYSYQQIEQELRGTAMTQLDELRSRGIGRPAPEIDGVDLDGRPMKLSDSRGKVVVLSFWATSCFPCMKFIPHERALLSRLKEMPFVLLGVNSDTDAKALADVITKQKITWRSFRDKRGNRPAISDEWKILGFPTLYLIDHEGIVRMRWIGAPPPEDLIRRIDQLVEAALQKK